MTLLKKISWLPLVGVVLLLWAVLFALDPVNPIVRSFVLPKLFVFWASLALLALALICQPDLASRLPHPESLKDIVRLSLLWLGWLCLTAMGGAYPLRSWLGNYTWQLGVLTQIGLWMTSFFVWLAVRTHASAKFLWHLILWSCLPILLYGTLQYFGLEPVKWYRWGDAGPVMATLGNENHLGAYLAMVLPLTLMKLLTMPSTHGRLLLGGLLVWQVGVLWATNAIGAWLAATFACVLVGWWFWRFVRWQTAFALIMIFGLSAGATVWVASQGDKVGEQLRQHGLTREIRPFTWATAWGTVAAHPWVGWGSASFELTQARYASSKFREYIFPLDKLMDRTHNLWLELTLETGLIGLGLWLLLWGLIIFTVLRSVAALTSEMRAIVLSGLAALIAYGVYQVANPSELGTLVLFYILLGLILSAAFVPVSTEITKPSPALVARLVLLLFFVMALGGAGQALWQWATIG